MKSPLVKKLPATPPAVFFVYRSVIPVLDTGICTLLTITDCKRVCYANVAGASPTMTSFACLILSSLLPASNQ